MGPKSSEHLAGCIISSSLRVLQSGIRWGCSHLKTWLGLEGPFSGWLTHMLRNSLLALLRRSQFLTTLTSPRGCSCIFTTWQLPFLEREYDLRDHEAEATMSFMPCSQELQTFISAMCYWWHRSALFSMREDYTRAYISGDKNHWGPYYRPLHK